jgi:hypothetical protein
MGYEIGRNPCEIHTRTLRPWQKNGGQNGRLTQKRVQIGESDIRMRVVFHQNRDSITPERGIIAGQQELVTLK